MRLQNSVESIHSQNYSAASCITFYEMYYMYYILFSCACLFLTLFLLGPDYSWCEALLDLFRLLFIISGA